MAIQLALEHRTVYRFDRWAHLFPHVMRLRPAPSCRTPILSYSLKVDVDALDRAMNGWSGEREYPRTLDLRRAPRTRAFPDP